MGKELVAVSELDKRIASIATADEALNGKDFTARCAEMAKLLGLSVEEVNEYGLRYLRCTWRFGELVEGVPSHRPKAGMDNGLPGSEEQRKYARRLRRAVEYEALDEYVRQATEDGVQASIAGLLQKPHGTQGSGIDEWCTPADVIADVRAVLGEIDLDPASNTLAQETIQAKRFFTIEDDALTKSWKARSVFMNPPYSTGKIFAFVQKLRDELNEGNIEQAILLTNSLTDTSWFHIAEEISQAICFTRGRLHFLLNGEAGGSPTWGQAFFYFGDEPDNFGEIFRSRGFVR